MFTEFTILILLADSNNLHQCFKISLSPFGINLFARGKGNTTFGLVDLRVVVIKHRQCSGILITLKQTRRSLCLSQHIFSFILNFYYCLCYLAFPYSFGGNPLYCKKNNIYYYTSLFRLSSSLESYTYSKQSSIVMAVPSDYGAE
jgi:hypothetical protein